MRTRNFEVPTDIMEEFATIIEQEGLNTTIDGVSGDGDIEVSVDYEVDQKPIINKIHDMIDRYNEELEDQEEDEDDDDDEEDDTD
jgi:hypothetical protein